ncbi:MAG: hypothetical protein IKJ29_00010 [Akkermansia sp.]|nr:hypothetical protein [Akkermansia sp.]
MNRYTYFALALAPVVCMTAQATPEVAALDSLKAAVRDLTTLVSSSQEKDLPTLVADLDTLLATAMPGILTQLEPLTDEQRLSVIQGIMQSEELGKLAEAAAPLCESKAAAPLMPALSGEGDPVALSASLPFKTKVQVVDIAANVLKLAIGLGVDSPAVQGMLGEMMGGGEEDCPSECADMPCAE